jgi:hypothetical protein
MKVLLDECIDQRFRLGFAKNGQLPEGAEREGFDILLTADQNIPAQRFALLQTDSVTCCRSHLPSSKRSPRSLAVSWSLSVRRHPAEVFRVTRV